MSNHNFFNEPFKMWMDSTNMFKNNSDFNNYNQLFQKNYQAWVEAGKATVENAQSFMRRNAEMMQKSASEATEAAQDLCARCGVGDQ